MRLVLASASPRRADLLQAAGFAFDIHPAEVDERRLGNESPDAHVRRLATEKASHVAAVHPGAVILGADTVVVVDEDILGKPADDGDARRMLRSLSGREHVVLTGIALGRAGEFLTAVERTTVRFGVLTDAEIAWYVASGEPRDKAGAYAIQGLASRFVEAIDGSYTNVVGLPVARLYRLLAELGQPGRVPGSFV